MVFDYHDIADMIVEIDRSGRIRDYELFYSQKLQNSDRSCQLFIGIAFIAVDSPVHAGYGLSSEPSYDKLSRVAGDGRFREIRDLGKVYAYRVLQKIGVSAERGPQDYPELRDQVCLAPDIVCCFFIEFKIVLHDYLLITVLT